MTNNKESESQILSQFKAMSADLQRLAMKLGELETERDEHILVLENLKELEKDRKCFRLMNGVLIEQTVEQTMPVLSSHSENIKTVSLKLAETFKTKQAELRAFQEKHQIRILPQGMQPVANKEVEAK